MRPEVSTEPLQSKTIEGIWVDGTRVARTYPASFQGSDGSITTVEERWVSKELGLVVFLKLSDPRTGDRAEQLRDVDRSEPNPTLFQVPADYTITGDDSR